MITKSQKVRLGIFTVISVGILFITIAVISFAQLFEDKDTYYIAYEDISVGGLDIGSSVKYLGLKVGVVNDISIDPQNINRVIVQISIDRGTPIKNDVRAEIVSVGITGLKQIEIRGGSNEAGLLSPGKFIIAGKSFTEEITGKAEVIAEKIELVMNNLIEFTSDENQSKVFTAFEKTSETVSSLNTLITENEPKISTAVDNINDISNDLKYLSISAREAVQTINNMVQSDTLKRTMVSVSNFTEKLEKSDIYNLIDNLNLSILKINKILNQTEDLVLYNRTNLIQSVQDFKETSASLKNAAKMIEQNPSILILGSEPSNPPDNLLEE